LRILLDENLDWRLARDLRGHEVESVSRLGWSGIKNGELLSRAEKQFDVLLTMDSNMQYQQNIANFDIALVVLQAASNRLADTRSLMPQVMAVLPTVKPGTVTAVR